MTRMKWLTAAALGAGLAWFLDPTSGARRRAVAKDKAGRALRKGRDAAEATGRDLRNRVSGMASTATRLFQADTADDSVVTDRVRARVGRFAGHPAAIGIVTTAGVVHLSGPVLAAEADHLVRAVSRVRGVQRVEDLLERHADGSRIPALQGGTRSSGPRNAFLPARWSPTTQLAVGAATAATLAAVAYRSRRRRHEDRSLTFETLP